MTLRVVIILVYCLLCQAVPGRAMEGYDLAVGEFLKQGIKAYKNNDQSAAIDNFSKVLLIEADNKTALEYLAKMGMPYGIYGQSMSPVEQMALMNQESNIFKVRIDALQQVNAEQAAAAEKLRQERDKLCRLVEEKKAEVELLTIQKKVVEADLYNRSTAFDESVELYRQVAHDMEFENEFLTRTLDRHKELINEKEQLLEEKDGDLKSVRRRMLQIEDEKLGEVLRLEKQLNVKEVELARLKSDLEVLEAEAAAMPSVDEIDSIELLKARDQYIAELKDRLAESKRELGFLKKNFQEISREEIQKLKDQLASNDQQEEISILKERLSDAHERLTLVDSIVTEKEERIESLQQELSRVRQQCGEKCADAAPSP